MPEIAWNQSKWNDRYQWEDGGEEWSHEWGGSRTQWLSCVYPRLAPFLPATSIVEIAPGYGRWTQYLLPECTSYLGVDLAERCVDACRERFAYKLHATFAVGDGLSLPQASDTSVDLVFSFDSLVHAEADVLSAYLRECQRILTPDGVAFIHHSNVGAYRRSAWWRDMFAVPAERFPARHKAVLALVGVAGWHNYRGRSVTAQRFADLAREAGLACVGQELIGWSSALLTDCISLVARPGSRWDRPTATSRNRYFRLAARSSRAAAHALEF